MIKKTISMFNLSNQENDTINYFLELKHDNEKKIIKLGNFCEETKHWEWDQYIFLKYTRKEIFDFINKSASIIKNEFGTNINKYSFIKHSKLNHGQHFP